MIHVVHFLLQIQKQLSECRSVHSLTTVSRTAEQQDLRCTCTKATAFESGYVLHA